METKTKAKKSRGKGIFFIIPGVIIIVIAAVLFIMNLPHAEAPVEDPLSALSLSLDDTSYRITEDDTVVLPAGRPRIPQILCDDPSVDIFQAFFPDDQPVAEAVVRKDGQERRIKFIKDDEFGVEFQYDDRLYFANEIPNAVYESSDPDVAMVTLAGQIIITGVSDEGVTITATNGVEEEALTITRTIKAPVGIYLLTGQSNAAYFFADPATASQTRKGSCYVYDISEGVLSIQSLNNEDETMARGNIEAGICKSLYDTLGEKIIIVNSGVSGEKIDTFLPFDGASYSFTETTWQNLSYIFETPWFQEHFEPRIRSYIWVQGESDDWLYPESYVEQFLKIHEVLRSPLYGFDYGFISQIVPNFFRPNDAQERLAQGYPDIFMGSRVTNQFSVETGELREDGLHYTQKGDNMLGEDIGKNIALVYTGMTDSFPE